MTARPLGPARLGGSRVLIRPPRLDDHAAWRRIRLRDAELIEPFWYSSPDPWPDRHTETQWIREYLVATAEARRGRRVAGVIEVDGAFAGQCELVAVDSHTRTAELSIWIDSRHARRGLGGLAAALMLDHGFATLALDRIVAPICPANTPATRGAKGLGFIREALMSHYFDVGGTRRDHALWALTRADIPPNGFAHNWIHRVSEKNATPGAAPSGTTAQPGDNLGSEAPHLSAATSAGDGQPYNGPGPSATARPGDGIGVEAPGPSAAMPAGDGQPFDGRRPSGTAHLGDGRACEALEPSVIARSGDGHMGETPGPSVAVPAGDGPMGQGTESFAAARLWDGRVVETGGTMLAARPALDGSSRWHRDEGSAGVGRWRRRVMVAYLAGRLVAGRVRRRMVPMRGACSVRLGVPGYGGAVVRGRRFADGGRRTAGPGEGAWWREFARSRGGLRSPGGLVLVLEVDGRWAGEFRLFDLDMFDRNARLHAWADSARADIGVRTAATRVVLEHAFHTLGLYRVATEIDAADTESAAVAACAGLREEGIMRNHHGPTGRRADHTLWASTVASPGRP